MSIVKSEFALALNQVATERGISADDVISSIEAAILAAYKKETMEDPTAELPENITVKLNRDTGEAHILEDEKDITPPGFGRIAAQTAKQVVLQKIREAEKKTIISHYKSQVGTVARGRVIRYDGYNAFVDIGRVEAFLPKEEQIRSEKYAVNNNMLFYIKEIGEDKFGNSKIILSRTAPELIAELFKKEVPEITNGTVEIKKVVREPGERAKIAVFSSQAGVDPVGACVGQKGVRVQTVTNEFNGMEKIDIIQWSRDDKLFITAALSPAKITEIEVDVDAKRAKVSVDKSQTPLAIGKSGINVNLASRLTGYDIDIIEIKSEEAPAEEKKEETETKTAQEATEPAQTETKSEEPKAEETSKQEEAVSEQPAPSEVQEVPTATTTEETIATAQETVQDPQEAVADQTQTVQTPEETVQTPEAPAESAPSTEEQTAENQLEQAPAPSQPTQEESTQATYEETKQK